MRGVKPPRTKAVTGHRTPKRQTEKPLASTTRLLPIVVLVVAIAIWSLSGYCGFSGIGLSFSLAVAKGLGEELRTGRLPGDLVASLFPSQPASCSRSFWVSSRIVAGSPCSLALCLLRRSISFAVFRRCWIPFAILWFGIGTCRQSSDLHGLFLSGCRQHSAAVASIPSIYFRVAHDYGFHGLDLLTK